MNDPYLDSRTGVLRNRAGIGDPDRLREAEFAVSRAGDNTPLRTMLDELVRR